MPRGCIVTLSTAVSGIDWVKVSEHVFAGLISLAVAFAVVAFREAYRNRRRKLLQPRFVELGELRGAAIRIRNQGEGQSFSGQALTDWIQSAQAVEQALVDKARDIAAVFGLLIEWQDRVPTSWYPNIRSPQQRQLLQDLSGAILRAEAILNKYEF